ncbi:hypothetical protein J2X31_003496 [Flavobacterium arsenatis]|uniref:Glutaminyl-tRNA synthetase n=1 Tax=Flavobacterium arsenatis TaxID=1484332 RepID=A0ABU1TUB4_9FLAO|nr:DUF6327 family protein [Flavobacterium arsenatis]MDR6969465.1 hypothetical protein [Flavobacterium arsenatis]
MERKKYSSYAEIDRDLEILKIEREIHYQKLTKSFDNTKDSLNPSNMIPSVPKMALTVLGGLSGPIKSIGFSFLLKKLFRM